MTHNESDNHSNTHLRQRPSHLPDIAVIIRDTLREDKNAVSIHNS